MSAGIALELYTLREQASQDFVGMLKEVAAAGYEAVEFAGYGGIPASELRQIIDDLGLRAVSSHVGFKRFEEAPERVIEELQILGGDYAVVPGLPQDLRNPESVPALSESFNRWGEACRAADLRFGYHNHGWELAPMTGSTMLELLATNTDPQLVDLQLDVFWALSAGADPIPIIQSLAGRIPTLHAKEMSRESREKDTTIGDGLTDWTGVMAAAHEAGTEWYIVEQEDDPANAYRDIRRSLANLRRLLEDGAG
jgi:sugar phosphate isomerase/epimerase